MQKLNCFWSRPAVILSQSIEARYQFKNEGVLGLAPTGAHLSDQQFYCLLSCDLYLRFDGN